MNNSNINIYTQTSNNNILQHLDSLLEIDDKDNLIILNQNEYNSVCTENVLINDEDIEHILYIDETEYLNTNIPKFEPFFKDNQDLEDTLNIDKSNKINIQQYCTNCGKHNHSLKECKDPVKSYGLICFYPTPVNIDMFSKIKKTNKFKIIFIIFDNLIKYLL